MAIRLISSEFSSRDGTVIIEADQQEEATSLAARELALQTAASRLSSPGLADQPSPYPVDANGESPEELITGKSGQRAAAFRCDYRVNGRF